MNEHDANYWSWAFSGLCILGLILCCSCLGGCFRIPVTVHPPNADDGQPIALPTAPTGVVQNADGSVDKLNPAFREPRPSDHPPQQSFDLNGIIQIVLYLLGGGGLAGAVVMRQRAVRAERNEDEVYADLQRKETKHEQ